MTANIRINAELFRIAYTCVSTEETRYYLTGVFVEPHAVRGVNLVATDGHRLIHVYDENGHADKPEIIRLSKDTLKACKRTKYEIRREIHVDTNAGAGGIHATAQVFAFMSDRQRNESGEYHDVERSTPVAIEANCVVDGTFPDYRRVIPQITDKREAAGFNSKYIADFGAAGRALQEFMSEKSRTDCLTIYSFDASRPALIRWSDIEIAFGILMPLRRSSSTCELPAFFNARVEMMQAAA